MSDILKRLRDMRAGSAKDIVIYLDDLCFEAAVEIEKLQAYQGQFAAAAAEIERLRAELEQWKEAAQSWSRRAVDHSAEIEKLQHDLGRAIANHSADLGK